MKKKIFLILLCTILVTPAYAVFNEKNISRTISVLRHELHSTLELRNQRHHKREKSSSQMEEVREKNMYSTVKWIDELTVILYSQKRGFTLDQTYAADCVVYEYNKFNKNKKPRYTNTLAIDTEIERYQHLIEALKLLPPQIGQSQGSKTASFAIDSLLTTLPPAQETVSPTDTNDVKLTLLEELVTYGRNAIRDTTTEADNGMFYLPEEAQADRDSCIAYAEAIIKSYNRQKERIKEADLRYNEMKTKLQSTYEYAAACFEEIKNNIFVTGQESYFHILANFKRYAHDTANDLDQQYGTGDSEQDWAGLRQSQWKGIVLISTLLYSFSQLLLISLVVILLTCVILKNVKPFNTEWFKQTRPVVILLAISVIYSLVIVISGLMFPMSNFTYVAATRVLVYLWFAIALLLSLLIALKKEDARNGLKAYLPILVMGLLLMLIRAMFIPDKMIHLILSPILLVFLLWQIQVTRNSKVKLGEYKNITRLQYVTAVVFGLSLAASLFGYSLLSMMFLMWWIFQGATLATIASIRYILKFYEKNGLAKKKAAFAAGHKMVSRDKDGDFIQVTWLFDLCYRALLPVAGILSLLGCIWLGLGIFNLSQVSQGIFHKAFFDFKGTNGEPILQVSIFKLALVSALFFVFRYLNYLVRSIYRTNKFDNMLKASGKEVLRENDINLTLAYNVIGIIIWGMFVIYSIYVLKIPLGAISIVAAGLATGIGLALKDVLNNFIYGIQLMSGRLRVGDILECDGIRGTVEKISYQSTEIQTLTGSVISFTNSSLFNKNFQNLTKNSPYEYVAIKISISYGEDVEKVRSLVTDALKDFNNRKDKYGRHLVEQTRGIWITFGDFADSSVDLAIKQYVLVESKYAYTAEVKELVYNLFNSNGIVIPFPQQEVSILNFPPKN